MPLYPINEHSQKQQGIQFQAADWQDAFDSDEEAPEKKSFWEKLTDKFSGRSKAKQAAGLQKTAPSPAGPTPPG